MSGFELSVMVQPLAGLHHPWKGLVVGWRAAGNISDFESFQRSGFELGYQVAVEDEFSFLVPGASLCLTTDRWSFYSDSGEGPQGNGRGYGAALRPFLRFSILEVSAPVEIGRVPSLDGTFAMTGTSYVSAGLQLGIALF